MRRIVLIDGENLVYGLRHLLSENGDKAPRSVIENFSFRGLIEELLADNTPSEILWFGARLRLYEQSDEIKQKSEQAIKLQAKFVNLIQQQKITFIKVGYLRARETDPCEQCGHTSWKLAEKGVDVGLAVRMVQEANETTEIVVISADTDLLPAFLASSKLGAKLMHVGYETQPIYALTKASDKSRVITLPLAQKYKK
jgi:NYN domain